MTSLQYYGTIALSLSLFLIMSAIVDKLWLSKSKNLVEDWFGLVTKDRLIAAGISLENTQVALATANSKYNVERMRSEHLYNRIIELESKVEDTKTDKISIKEEEGWLMSFSCDLRDSHHRYERLATKLVVEGESKTAHVCAGKSQAYKDVSDRLFRYLQYKHG
jgi:hypothetical protein